MKLEVPTVSSCSDNCLLPYAHTIHKLLLLL